MSVIKDSNIDPRLIESPLDRVEHNKENKKKAKESLEEQLAKWRTFYGTKTGQVVSDLTDPYIKYYQEKVCMGVEEVRRFFDALGMGITDDAVRSYQDECRGALKVWKTIKYKLGQLEGRLKELAELEEKESEKEGTLPKEIERYV